MSLEFSVKIFTSVGHKTLVSWDCLRLFVRLCCFTICVMYWNCGQSWAI